MTHRCVVPAVIALTIATAVPTLLAQRKPGARPPVNGTGTIVGRVFDANTNTPVRGAEVEATNDMFYVDAITDDEGRFELANVSPGAWDVTVQKGGYFPWHLGQTRPFQIPERVRIGAGQRFTANIPLTRGGVITGRVFDETGEPLAGLQVKVYRSRMVQGYRRLESVGVADRTDDMGAYRIYGLPPGDYYVAASLRLAPPDSVVQTTYSPTYYPGTGDVGEAQRIRVTLGTESTAIFPLLPVRTVRLTGIVQTSSGGAADAFLNLTSENSELGVPLGIGGVTQRGGTFILPDVPPGRYVLTASLRGDGAAESTSIPLVVGTDDLSGLSLVTEAAGRIRGRFALDRNVSRPLPADLEVTAMAARANGTVVSHGTGPLFTLDELDEPFFLRVNLPEGWVVTRVEIAGADVTDSKAIVVPLAQQADARIVVSDRMTQISGGVTKDGQPATGSVVVFPDDPARWSYPSRFLRRADTDARGRFRIAGLPAHQQYLAIATDFLEDGEENDPEFLERMRARALTIALGESDSRTIDLPLIER